MTIKPDGRNRLIEPQGQESKDEAGAKRASLGPLLALRPYLLRHKGMVTAALVALVIAAAATLAVPLAVVRSVARHKPVGAVHVLLAYLPSAADDAVVQEVEAALVVLAHAEGKPDKVLEEALNDKDPERKAAATAALGRNGPTGPAANPTYHQRTDFGLADSVPLVIAGQRVALIPVANLLA